MTDAWVYFYIFINNSFFSNSTMIVHDTYTDKMWMIKRVNWLFRTTSYISIIDKILIEDNLLNLHGQDIIRR